MNSTLRLPPISSFDVFSTTYSHSQNTSSTWNTLPYNQPNILATQTVSISNVYAAETAVSLLQLNNNPAVPLQSSKRPLVPSPQQSEASKRAKIVKNVQPSDFKIVESLRSKPIMKKFPDEEVHDFKHVLYNCLVDNYNSPNKATFVQIFSVKQNGVVRHGFKFNEKENPEKRLAELYALHLRKARLDVQDQNSVFIQDLYKFYLRSCVELLTKYFEKRSKWTYLYDDVELFVPDGTLAEAADRIKSMKSRFRRKKKVEEEEEVKSPSEDSTLE